MVLLPEPLGPTNDYTEKFGVVDVVPPFPSHSAELADAVAELEEQAIELQASLHASGELLPGYARSHVLWDELREMLDDRRHRIRFDGVAQMYFSRQDPAQELDSRGD